MDISHYFHFSNIILERLQESDSNEAVALINRAYAYQNEYKNEPRITRDKLWHQAQKSQFYVLKEEGKIIGTIYIQTKNRSLHFGLLSVDQSYRGIGLAPALLSAVELYARDHACLSLQLDYMSIAPWLKRYYEKYGFCETGEVENWGTIDLIRMRKDLG